MLPIAAVFFGIGYLLQRTLINPFIGRAEHEQFILLVGLATVIVNGLLMIFGPDARPINLPYSFDSYAVGPMFLDKVRVFAAVAAIAVAAALFLFFRYTRTGTAIRACADNLTGAAVVGLDVKQLYAVTFGLGLACVGAAGTLMATIADASPSAGAGLYAARLHHRDRRRARIDGRRADRRHPDRRLGSAGRILHSAVDEEHVLLRAADHRAGAASAGPDGAAPVNADLVSHPLRGKVLSLLLLLAFAAAPVLADRYLLSVLILVFYFAYLGQAWNLLMGFAGQLSLGHALYLGLGAYTATALWTLFGIGPWLGVFIAIPGCRGGRTVDRLARLAICHRGRLFRAADDRVCRIHPDRLRPSGSHRRRRRTVSAGQWRSRGQMVESRRRTAAVLLSVAGAGYRGHHPGRAAAPVSARLPLARRSRGSASGAGGRESTSSAPACWRC